jgi:DNA-binding response OmpR family regulator
MDQMTTRILIVEDETTLRETLAYNLAKEGYEVSKSGDGAEALEMARAEKFDLIVLDIMLPNLDGLSFCRILRKEQATPTPALASARSAGASVIMLTARGGEVDRIIGLESGADDYIVKPFSLGEFLARVRAVLRRAPSVALHSDRLESGDLQLDLTARRVSVGGREIKLSHKEFDLLATLVRNKGAVLSRDLLLEEVWGYDRIGDDRTVDVHVRWLREKIEVDPSDPRRIVTLRGVGYRFEG